MLCPVINIHGFITVAALYSANLIYACISSCKTLGRSEQGYVHLFSSRAPRYIYQCTCNVVYFGLVCKVAVSYDSTKYVEEAKAGSVVSCLGTVSRA